MCVRPTSNELYPDNQLRKSQIRVTCSHYKITPIFSCVGTVINIEWDYGYYQPWSNNKWLIDEMMAVLDKDITMQSMH